MASINITPSFCLDSIAEAYLEQGKRDFDRGDYAAAKRLFNKAAFNAENTYKDKIYVAAIYHNAAEAYRKLVEVNPDYSDLQDDNLAVDFLKSKLRAFDPYVDSDQRTVLADETRMRISHEGLSNRSYPGVPIDNREKLQWIAVHYLRLSLQIKELALGAESEEVAKSMETLALLYDEYNTQLEEAEALLRKALAIRKHSTGPTSADDAITLWDLAKVLKTGAAGHTDAVAKRSMIQDAANALTEALNILQTKNLAKCTLAGHCYADLSILYFDQRKFPASEHAFNSAYDILGLDSSHKKDFQTFKQSHQQIADLALADSIVNLKNAKGKSVAIVIRCTEEAHSSAVRAGNKDLAEVLSKKIKALRDA
jgi:tetratricopeptide (TPR) repeat protein